MSWRRDWAGERTSSSVGYRQSTKRRKQSVVSTRLTLSLCEDSGAAENKNRQDKFNILLTVPCKWIRIVISSLQWTGYRMQDASRLHERLRTLATTRNGTRCKKRSKRSCRNNWACRTSRLTIYQTMFSWSSNSRTQASTTQSRPAKWVEYTS